MKKAWINFGFSALIVGNILTTTGDMAPLTLLFCAVAALAWPVLDLLEVF